MITQARFVNLKDWRENMHTYWEKSKGKQIRFIVCKHSKPMFEVKPLYSQIMSHVEDFDITAFNASSSSFDFLKDEPDLYSVKDLKEKA